MTSLLPDSIYNAKIEWERTLTIMRGFMTIDDIGHVVGLWRSHLSIATAENYMPDFSDVIEFIRRKMYVENDELASRFFAAVGVLAVVCANFEKK